MLDEKDHGLFGEFVWEPVSIHALSAFRSGFWVVPPKKDRMVNRHFWHCLAPPSMGGSRFC
jgi:hypothetical protein